ncbi:hypothetical protein ABB37_07765 [Leptomonas pyrrhocoris]|uniref:Uncharacterized protein n=1 Tax=Leptomonas pyrrhocoris TaxID=157538 RepID=A0A0N0DSQ9_LEPPY|nr:hypothetical protein ABB37_07765 [Leptomonas pyrrhocoris]KPA76442.1 hypothetical protein ABB37_07765 [Leptomonas pyrrhocoris]|eukprot:XP_015654881.1 hypothetical protein ABB37_07765 [Leptomonas pyrrhocoris]
MPYGRALRHASVLLLFGVLLLIGVFVDNTLDRSDGAYADDAREQRAGGVSLRTLLHSPSYWRRVPLTLDRREYPYVTDAFASEFLQRTTPPQLADVRDNRTLTSDDFFEELQLWRRPGSAAAQMSRVMQAQIEQERVAARATAVQQRHSKSWRTRREPPPPLLSALWPSFLMGEASRRDAPGATEDGVPRFVEVRYASRTLYYGRSTAVAARRTGNNEETNMADPVVPTAHNGTTVARRQAVSLATDEARLVPYPFVPYTGLDVGEAAAQRTQDDKGDKVPTDADGAVTPPTTLVRIGKGKLRYTASHRTAPHAPTHGWDHFYIALNLWKSEGIIPDLTDALITFLEDDVKPIFDLATSVVVSVYANVSPDRTAELIESILIPRLHAIGVHTVYATTEGSCLGYVERRPFHERIEWMACIRNEALKPLYDNGMRVFHSAWRADDGDDADAPADNGSKRHDPNTTASSDGLVVLFFNDIFFRSQDITTLLESRAETLMSSKVRPHGWVSSASTSNPTTPATADPSATANAGRTDSPPRLQQPKAGSSETTTRGTTFDMACGMDFYYTFYDTWVTRDRLGNPFEAQMPYSDDHATQEAFYRILNHDLGKPERATSMHADASVAFSPEMSAVPVKCCWNGVAAIRGRFFLPPTPAHRLGFPARETRLRAQRRWQLLPHRVNGINDEIKNDTININRNDSAATQPQGGVESGEAVPSFISVREDAPLVVMRPSGAVYDLLGSAGVAMNITGMAAYLTRVWTRRLQSTRAAWNSTRAEIAELTGHPFYSPVVYANTSSFTALLQAVLTEQQHGEHASNGLTASTTRSAFEWLTLALTSGNVTALGGTSSLASLIADLQEKNVEADGGQAGATAQPMSEIRVRDDSTYYVARHPAVRFRHAFTPSYGATVSGLKPVRDDVCLSSECLLICQDVMQAAILQDRRAPVILLNPHVRVAYDVDHFARVTRHTWFFEHPYVYWVWVMARRVQLWWSTGSSSGAAADSAVRELGKDTSATDDWLRDPATTGTSSTHPPSSFTPNPEQLPSRRETLTIEDGRGNVIDVGVMDVVTLTQMACQRITAGSIGLAVGAFFPLLRFGQLLLVALLLRWLCWSIQSGVAAKVHADVNGSNGNGGDRSTLNEAVHNNPSSLSLEEQWWSLVYNAVWYSRVARRLRSWVDGLSATDWTASRHGGDRDYLAGEHARGAAQLSDANEAFYARKNLNIRRGGGSSPASSSSISSVPLLHQQLRQHYRRKKVAATLGSCAHQTRCFLRAIARAVLWLLGTLCCVRCWCGCRPPGPPPAPRCCAATKLGRWWNTMVVGVEGASGSGEPRRPLVPPARFEMDRRGATQGGEAWRRAAGLLSSYTSSYSNDEQRFAVVRDGSRSSSYGRSAAAPASPAGVFRESGDEAENWVPGPQPQQWWSSPWQRRSAAAAAAADVATPTTVATHGINPLVAPVVLVNADSPVPTPLLLSDNPYGGGGALQSVRPRNTNARAAAPYSPTSPSGVRAGDFVGGGEASV